MVLTCNGCDKAGEPTYGGYSKGMLDYCGQHGVMPDVEVIAAKDINDAYERMIKGDVRYRFVIDCATL
jgi:uncharacterized zinc-type alcohol dehydrogenase-like protein